MFGVTHYFSIALSIKALTQKILAKLKILLPHSCISANIKD